MLALLKAVYIADIGNLYKIFLRYSFVVAFSFTALTLFVGRQEEHPPVKTCHRNPRRSTRGYPA